MVSIEVLQMALIIQRLKLICLAQWYVSIRLCMFMCLRSFHQTTEFNDCLKQPSMCSHISVGLMSVLLMGVLVWLSVCKDSTENGNHVTDLTCVFVCFHSNHLSILIHLSLRLGFFFPAYLVHFTIPSQQPSVPSFTSTLRVWSPCNVACLIWHYIPNHLFDLFI